MPSIVEKTFELYRLRDFSFLALILCLALLPLSINLSSIAFGGAIFLRIVQGFLRGDNFQITRELRMSALLGLIFLTYILVKSFFLKDFKTIFSALEENSKYVLLLLTPFVLKKKEPNKLLLFGLFLGVMLCVVLAICYSLFNGIKFDRGVFMRLFDLHHTYLSMFLLLMVNHFLNVDRDQFPALIKILVAALCFLVIYCLNSKVSMVIFVVILTINLIWNSSKRSFLLYLISIGLALLVFIKFMDKDSVNYEVALDYRTEIWQASLEQIKKNIVFGSLYPDEKQLLNYQHYLSGKHYFLDMDINSHNQYLSIVLKFGVFGLLLLLSYAVFFSRLLRKRFPKAESREAFGFAIIIAVVFFIENILDRHHGVVFFTVFYNYYIVLLADESN